jgi:ApaG protein
MSQPQSTQSGHSDTTTQGIRVQVGASYLPEQSNPELGRYFFVYRVVLTNLGNKPSRLLSRKWLITDGDGDTRHVEGPGVVGEHPRLEPGESYEYLSGCPLATSWGTMEGSYRWQEDDGRIFEVAIGRFFLAPNTAPLDHLDAETLQP